MDRFKDKVAGLPVWAWSLILGLVLVAVMYWFRARSAAASAGSGSGDSGGTTSPLDGLLGDGASLPPSAPTTGTDQLSDFVSNFTWETQGVTLLVGRGVAPLKAQAALEKYINGDPLTAEEQGWINDVVGTKGLPPQGNAGLSESIDALTGRTPSQQKEWDSLQAEQAAEQAANTAEAQRVAQLAAADQAAAARAQAEADASNAATTAANTAAARAKATDEANMRAWLLAIDQHTWKPGWNETAVFARYGRTAELNQHLAAQKKRLAVASKVASSSKLKPKR